MQRLFSSTVCVLLATMFVVLPSFSTRPGGEGFEIYLNNKVILQQFGNQLKTVKEITIDPQHADAKLTVKYHHCGQVGKNRRLVIRDEDNRLLKQWNFEDASSPAEGISCSVKEILGLSKNKPTTLRLYYSSNELPGGRQLAAIVTGKGATAKVR